MQTFRYLVLGLLRHGEPRHGYALMKEYQEHTGLRLSTGNFYRELQRLSVEGLVRTASNPEGADPRRAPYRITEAGAAFDAAHAIDPADPIAAYLAAAHLADEGGGNGMRPLVATLIAAAERGRLPSAAPFPQFALVDDLSAGTPIFSPAAYADGFASMAAGRFRDALEQFRAAAARDPLVTDPAGRTPRVLAGIAALRDRRGAEAIGDLEGAAAALPGVLGAVALPQD